MPERRDGVRRLALAGLHVAAVWATASARAEPWVWGLALPAFLALGLPRLRFPLALQRLLARAVAALAGAVFASGAAWVLYSALADALVERVGLVGGLLLTLAGAGLCCGGERLGAGRGVLPAALGALLASALAPKASVDGPLALASVAIVVWLASGVPGRVGWRLATTLLAAVALALGLMRLLPWAQPQVERQLVAALVDGSSASSGFGPSSSLGDVASLGLSQRKALRVYATRELKLRGRVFTRFDGRTWTDDEAPGVGVLPVADAPSSWPSLAAGSWRAPDGAQPHALAGAVSLSIVPLLAERQLFVPAGVAAARLANPQLHWSALGTLRVDAPPAAYDLVARAARPAPEPQTCAACLRLPPRLDPRLVSLAETLAAGAPTPHERVARTLAHLEHTCRYSLTPGSFTSRDALAEFVFEKRRGYCEYFASAAAILLRLQGLPTRYVNGFNVTAAQRAGDHYLVREADAHAWIDVQLPERGWVELDPTPAADYAELHAASASGGLIELWERLLARVQLLRLRLDADPSSRWYLAAAAALVLAFVLGRHFARRRSQTKSPHATARSQAATGLRPELRALVRRFDDECARRGAPRPAARGLLEHLELVQGGRFSPGFLRAGRRAADCVYAEVYAGRRAGLQDLSTLSAELRSDPPGAPRS